MDYEDLEKTIETLMISYNDDPDIDSLDKDTFISNNNILSQLRLAFQIYKKDRPLTNSLKESEEKVLRDSQKYTNALSARLQAVQGFVDYYSKHANSKGII